jgi:uncharacterized protein involved in exopolysaccharide biosynthesis
MQTQTMPERHVGASGTHEAEYLRLTLRDFARALPIIFLTMAVAVGAAIAYARTRPTTYRATASLLFNDAAYQQAVAGGYNPVDAQRRLKTSADMIRLPAVTEPAMRDLLGKPGFRPAGTKVKAEYSLDSNTMRIVATGRDRLSPALLANATSTSFLSYRALMTERALRQTRDVISKQIATAPTRSERKALVAKRNNLDALQALDDNDVQIAQRAIAATAPADKSEVKIGVIAGVLGALVGIAICLFRIKEPVPRLPDPWIEESDSDVE